MKNKYLSTTALLCLTMMLLSSCSELAYYGQAINGQWRLLELRQPLQSALNAPDMTPELRTRLQLAEQLRDFASRELLLPDNNSYKSYANLQRDYVVYNVFATPELSLELQSWCFPIAGCVSYRGYFDAAAAERFGQDLRQQYFDVYIAGVAAYSTLGWFDDPLLNTFIQWPEARLAELLFHELAHQQLYIADDTVFNESFATAVGQIGVQHWLQDKPQALEAYQLSLDYRKTFTELIAHTRSQLETLYATELTASIKQQKKHDLLRQLQKNYEKTKHHQWRGYKAYDRWFYENLNNAKLAAVNSYTHFGPAFKKMFIDADQDFALFYKRVRALSKLPKQARKQTLQALLAEHNNASSAPANATKPAVTSISTTGEIKRNNGLY